VLSRGVGRLLEPVDVNVDDDKKNILFVTQVYPQPREEDLELIRAVTPSFSAAPTAGSVASSAGACAGVGLSFNEVILTSWLTLSQSLGCIPSLPVLLIREVPLPALPALPAWHAFC